MNDLLQNNSEGFTTSITPVLSVRNGASAIEFYQQAFGAVELMRVTDPDGAVVAEMSIRGANFFLADESPGHANFSPESIGGSSVRLALTVSDPDAVAAQAIAAGAKEIYAVADQSYGWRLGRVLDPFGHHWEIGKPLKKK
jgi:PhnB protein